MVAPPHGTGRPGRVTAPEGPAVVVGQVGRDLVDAGGNRRLPEDVPERMLATAADVTAAALLLGRARAVVLQLRARRGPTGGARLRRVGGAAGGRPGRR
jgi:hypothetical protein